MHWTIAPAAEFAAGNAAHCPLAAACASSGAAAASVESFAITTSPELSIRPGPSVMVPSTIMRRSRPAAVESLHALLTVPLIVTPLRARSEMARQSLATVPAIVALPAMSMLTSASTRTVTPAGTAKSATRTAPCSVVSDAGRKSASVTSTSMASVAASARAVIVAWPGPSALTTPAGDTDATVASLDDHATLRPASVEPSAARTAAASCALSPTRSARLSESICTLPTAAGSAASLEHAKRPLQARNSTGIARGTLMVSLSFQ